jgi:pilus assembly protein CpaB
MFRRTWPRGSKILLVLAAVSGTLAFLLVQGSERRIEALHPATGPSVPIAIAAADLARGTVLSEAMLTASSMPRAFAPPGVIASPASAAGLVLTADIAEGEALTSSRLSSPRIGAVAALVPSGLRALVVATDLPAIAVRAGDRVEVYATYGGARPHTELVGSGLQVLRVLIAASSAGGIGPTPVSGPGGDGVSLVLLVDADGAARLAYARAFGQLEIAILGPDAATGSP